MHKYYFLKEILNNLISENDLSNLSLEKSNEIDSDRANDSLKRAQQRKTEQNSEINDARVEASLVRALNRLRVSKR